ncbi:Mitogen-activated protein kinase kinase kinase [Bertholletia excelsa]
MESVASSSSTPGNPTHSRYRVTPPVADRILRALRHRLRLLHRSDSDFFILGATGNVYTVTLSLTPSCSCPDRTTPCKHIFFVFIKVLNVPLDDACLRRRTLRPCQLSRLLSTPSSPETLAGPNVRQIFHQLFLQARRENLPAPLEIEDGTMCPVCLDELRAEEKLVSCSTCRNLVHEECLLTWKRASRRRSVTCVICRARWRNRVEQEAYLNLSAYVNEEDDVAEGEGSSMCCN